MKSNPVHVIGAGPAGLTAAITLVKHGIDVVVHEKNQDVGTRFTGDFQGIENWLGDQSAPEFFDSLGIQINFLFQPFFQTDVFGPDLQRRTLRPREPLFYLIERGARPGSLDYGLKEQALKAGVQFRWNDNVKVPPEGRAIVATGARAPLAIARGIVFETSHPNYAAGFLNNRFAPKGYAYLLVYQGRATFATCLFKNFSQNHLYFEKALAAMQKATKIDVQSPKYFGGFISFSLNPNRLQEGSHYRVGECAGFQDALWGFGIKPAMLSGFLAAQCILTRKSYAKLCQIRLYPFLKSTLLNRLIYCNLGNWGYKVALNRVQDTTEVISRLRNHFRFSGLKRVIYPIERMVSKMQRFRLISKRYYEV